MQTDVLLSVGHEHQEAKNQSDSLRGWASEQFFILRHPSAIQMSPVYVPQYPLVERVKRYG